MKNFIFLHHLSFKKMIANPMYLCFVNKMHAKWVEYSAVTEDAASNQSIRLAAV